jgi:hypothetical protein
MWLRLTVDEELTIRDAEASTEASPFAVCPAITSRYRELIGLRIGPGWRRQIKELFNGAAGCTHLTELLGPLATTAYQTIVTRRKRQSEEKTQESSRQKPALIDSCHAFASDGEVVLAFWPEFYTGKKR